MRSFAPASPAPRGPAARPARPELLAALLSAAALLLSSLPAQAGLFDALKPADKPLQVRADSSEAELAALAASAFGKASASREVRDMPRKLAISAFQIRFVTDTALSQQRGNQRAAMSYRLQAPAPEVYQALTEQARAQLQQALQAHGFELLSPEALLAADADFAARAAQAAGARTQEAGLLSKNGYLAVNASGTADSWGALQGVSEIKLAERLGVALLKVQLVLNFASVEEMGLLERGNAVGVKGSLALSLDDTGAGLPSRFAIATPLGYWDFPLRKRVVLPQPFAKAVTRLQESSSEAAIGFLKSLAGGGSSSAAYAVTPADDYAEQLAQALRQSTQLVVEMLQPR